MVNKIVGFLAPVIDIPMSLLTGLGAVQLYLVRRIGIYRLPMSLKVLSKVGIFPIRRHYYEPFFDEKELRQPLDKQRYLPGIDFDVESQKTLLSSFTYQNELKQIPLDKPATGLSFFYRNGNYEGGDSELLYSMVRKFMPKKIIEIGSGNSTLMIIEALKHSPVACEHICIEPYERPWLSKLPVSLIRKKVEETDLSAFEQLSENDILFIDSSHIIRPQGDVLFEYLNILPVLKPGVIVHIHDVFTPYDYPYEWLVEQRKLWNEQYLMEAFLSMNKSYKVLCSLHYMHKAHKELTEQAFPILASGEAGNCPGSFWIQRQ